MKQKKQSQADLDQILFDRIKLFLSVDLSDPLFEDAARKTLDALRERDYAFLDTDLEDPECLYCLHMALMSAIQLESGHDAAGKVSALH